VPVFSDFKISLLIYFNTISILNLLNAELNPICHLLAILGGATVVAVSRLRVKHVKARVVNGTANNRCKLSAGFTIAGVY